MQKILLIVVIAVVITFTSCYESMTGTSSSAKTFQKELVSFYTDPSTTPLKEHEKADFKGITFFEINEKYNVNADFTPIVGGKVITMPTSAQKVKRYKEYGIISFELDNNRYELTIYQSEPIDPNYANHLFLPFKDQTSGITSYGAGRYIDVLTSDIKQGKVNIDFNKSYNPYCAYSDAYNCPIPPVNNTLPVKIEAGVSYSL